MSHLKFLCNLTWLTGYTLVKRLPLMMTMGGVSYVRPNARLRCGHEKESSTPAQKLALPRGM